MNTMITGRLRVPSGRFRVEEVPVPLPGPGEALIEVKAAGVCLSDVHLIDGSLVLAGLMPHLLTIAEGTKFSPEIAGTLPVQGRRNAIPACGPLLQP
ncbi:hypothetical protein [Saccharopolyspora sp. NPDC002376]